MYLQTLTHQKLVTRTRRTFDRALCALPAWDLDHVPPNPNSPKARHPDSPHFRSSSVRFAGHSARTGLGALFDLREPEGRPNRNLAQGLSQGKTKHRLWLKLCDLLTKHANEVSGLNVDAIIRGGIRKFTDGVGRLWTSLAEYYYIRRKWNLHEKARDVFEEGIMSVVTVRDFSVIFYLYTQFEESMLTFKIESMSSSDEEDEGGKENSVEEKRMDDEDEDEDVQLDVNLSMAKLENKILNGLWLHDDTDNPHNVEQWPQRVKLFEGDPKKQILTYTEAHSDLVNARVIFNKAVQVYYKAVDHLASVWCERAEMELRHQNFKGALELMRRATAEPSVEVK
ncbi:hypothetical protein CMV_017583 [Castanea mollissima]|uniref:Pre-mRNA-splicing factor SYF1 central HAT repeats domain-containing protein n=1 Tax=Castanea mollissima TaxID=60419 RepID=A0A8J4VQF3_9ROSI|nr:hypothetical protein CMV_017583 [Castanea mollissima]